jgi:hypothetical protein
VIDRRGIITVHKCHVCVHAGFALKPNICKFAWLLVVISGVPRGPSGSRQRVAGTR